MQNLEVSSLGKLLENCKKHITFSLIKDKLDEDVNGREYQLMEYQNLDAIIVSPIISGDNKVTGFVGTDNPKENIHKQSIMQSVAKFIASFMDETELVRKLNKLSYYDSLTGLKNRQSFNDAVNGLKDKEIKSLGIVYVDIKGLREINDAKGILFGDAIIKKMGNTLTQIFGDDVYRVGGDEYVVFKENSDEKAFEANILQLRGVLHQEKEYTATIGFTWNHNYGSDMGSSKSYSGAEKYNRILLENLEMEISDDKYVVCLQPQMDLATGVVTSAEALVRRVGAGGIYQPPIHFIPFYEKEGIISKIDTFVFETVCKYLKEWREQGNTHIKSIAVSCSRMTIAEVGIVEIFSGLCAKYGVDRSQILIEITETTNAISEHILKRIIQNFNDAGFSVSLDDFGSGYSNLTSFVISDFDEVKIDMKLINDIHKNEKSRALTEVVLILCQKLNNLVSVAEGVECEEQFNILKQMGCNKGQGYYFDRPITFAEFTEKYVIKS